MQLQAIEHLTALLRPDEETKENTDYAEEAEEEIDNVDDLFHSVMLRGSLAKSKLVSKND